MKNDMEGIEPLKRILVAFIVVVTVAIVPGCGDYEEPPDPIVLDFSRVVCTDSGTEWVYTGFVIIQEVNMDDPPRWEDLTVTVERVDEEGMYPTIVTLIEPTPLRHTGTVENNRVYFYHKVGHETERVEALGGILITEMSLSFEGAEIYVNLGKKTLGACRISSDFPEPPVYITLDTVSVTALNVSGETSWMAAWNVTDVEELRHPVPWEEVSLKAEYWTTGLFVSRIPVSEDPASGGPYDEGVHGTDLHGWYRSPDGYVNNGDVIRLTGMDVTFEGAEICIRHNSTELKATRLPSDFP